MLTAFDHFTADIGETENVALPSFPASCSNNCDQTERWWDCNGNDNRITNTQLWRTASGTVSLLSVSVCFLRWSDGYSSMCPLTRVRIVKHFKVVGLVRIDVPTDQGAYCQAIINKQDYSACNSHTSTFYIFSREAKTMTTFAQITWHWCYRLVIHRRMRIVYSNQA